MAPKVQEDADEVRRRKRVFPRVSPRKARVSALARQFSSHMMQQDWISRHIYHRFISERKPWLGDELEHCMTSDELLTGKANASKSLVQIIPLKNKNIRAAKKKDA